MNHHAFLCSAISSSTSFEHWSQPLHIRVSVSRKYTGRSRSCANTQTSQPLVRDPLPNTQITVDLTAYLAIHLIHHTEDAVNGDSNASAKKRSCTIRLTDMPSLGGKLGNRRRVSDQLPAHLTQTWLSGMLQVCVRILYWLYWLIAVISRSSFGRRVPYHDLRVIYSMTTSVANSSAKPW
jgi:hypothetical protein